MKVFVALTYLAVVVGGMAGWIMNLYQVVVGLSAIPHIADISGIMVLKMIGILFAPLGVVLGYIG